MIMKLIRLLKFCFQFFTDAIAFTSIIKNSPCCRKGIITITNEVICRLECFYRQKRSVDLRFFKNLNTFKME